MFAGIGSMQALVPPQIMLIEAVGAIASLWLNLALTCPSSASGQAPFSIANITEALSASCFKYLKNLTFQLLANALSNGIPFLQKTMKAHGSQTN